MSRFVAAVVAFGLAGSALAGSSVGTLAQSEGTVLVNQGKQFITAQPNQALTAGDRIMVMEGSTASIKFANGCVRVISSGSLAMMTANASCDAGINITQISSKTAQAVGEAKQERDCDDDGIADSKDSDVDGDDVLNADDKYESCKAGATLTNNTGIWIVGGLAVAGAAALISDGDDETISP
jgi:hypothetical protein